MRVIHPSSGINCLDEAPITPLPPPDELESGTYTIFAYISRSISSDPVTASVKISFTVSAAAPPPGVVHPPHFPESESFWDVIDTLSRAYNGQNTASNGQNTANSDQNTTNNGQNTADSAHVGVVVGCAAESLVTEILTTLRNAGTAPTVHFCNTCPGVSRQNRYSMENGVFGGKNGRFDDDGAREEGSRSADGDRREHGSCAESDADACRAEALDAGNLKERRGSCSESDAHSCDTVNVDLKERRGHCSEGDAHSCDTADVDVGLDIEDWSRCVGDVNVSYVVVHAWGTPMDEYGRLLTYWSNRVAPGGVIVGSHYFSRGVCMCAHVCMYVCE